MPENDSRDDPPEESSEAPTMRISVKGLESLTRAADQWKRVAEVFSRPELVRIAERHKQWEDALQRLGIPEEFKALSLSIPAPPAEQREVPGVGEPIVGGEVHGDEIADMLLGQERLLGEIVGALTSIDEATKRASAAWRFWVPMLIAVLSLGVAVATFFVGSST